MATIFTNLRELAWGLTNIGRLVWPTRTAARTITLPDRTGTVPVESNGYLQAIANLTPENGKAIGWATGNIANLTLSSGAFSQTFISSAQTITAGGLLTIAHGLSSTPTHAQIWLRCTTAELGYSVNDETLATAGSLATLGNQGAAIRADSTNVYARLGSGAGAFNIVRYDNGNGATITNSNWQLLIKAWY